MNLDGNFKGKKIKFNFGSKMISIVFGIIVIIWLISGFYIVSPDEQGVVLRFGKYVSTTNPGPHFHIPYPFETVYTPKVTEVKRLEVGFRMISPGPPARYIDVPKEAFMLTGDENIVGIDFIVQYKIRSAKDYLFNVKDVEGTLRDIAEASMRAVIGTHHIDEVLTSGKFIIQKETKEMMQEISDLYNMGVLILNVQLQDVQPPDEVIAAFKDVASAREDKSKLINQAEGYRNDIIPKARGLAEKIIKEAEAYREQRIKRATGETSRFLEILKEYNKAPEITRKRLYIETMEDILPKIKKYIIDSDKKSNLLNILQLDNTKTIKNKGE